MTGSARDARRDAAQAPRAVTLVAESDEGGGANLVARALLEDLPSRGVSTRLLVGTRRSGRDDVVELPNEARRDGWARAWRTIGRGVDAVEPTQRAGKLARAVGEPRRALEVLRGREDMRFPGSWLVDELAHPATDVFHVHNLHAGYFDLAALARMTRRAPVVVTLHDMWLFTGHCGSSIGCERWREGCGACPDLALPPAIQRDATRYNLARKQRLTAGLPLFVVAPSKWLAERAAASILAVHADRIRIVPAGIDVGVFAPQDRDAARLELGLPPVDLSLSFTANRPRANPEKDLATLRRAVELFADSSQLAIEVLLIGDDSPEERWGRAIARGVGALRSAPAVARALAASDVYCHATRAESQGLAVLEAAACGLPVIAHDVGAVREQVPRDDAGGKLVPPGDPAAFAAALRDIMALTGGARRALGARGRRFVVENRERGAFVGRMIEVYVEAMNARGRGAS